MISLIHKLGPYIGLISPPPLPHMAKSALILYWSRWGLYGIIFLERGHDRPNTMPHMRPIVGSIWVNIGHPSGHHAGRHWAPIGPVWPTIRTTQGVATRAAVCAYHTIHSCCGSNFNYIYIFCCSVYPSHLQYLRYGPPTNGFQISSKSMHAANFVRTLCYISLKRGCLV